MNKASNKNFWNYNKKLQPYANANRKNMTMAEACLWKFVLRARKMKGYGFRRQRSVMNFIADFMCKELMLIIEVDGMTHWSKETKAKDEIRDKALGTSGFTTLRFTDDEVLNNIIEVQKKIEIWISERESPPPVIS